MATWGNVIVSGVFAELSHSVICERHQIATANRCSVVPRAGGGGLLLLGPLTGFGLSCGEVPLDRRSVRRRSSGKGHDAGARYLKAPGSYLGHQPQGAAPRGAVASPRRGAVERGAAWIMRRAGPGIPSALAWTAMALMTRRLTKPVADWREPKPPPPPPAPALRIRLCPWTVRLAPTPL